jgi:hypothetical protein
MEPIRTLKDYLQYKSILQDVGSLVRYYTKYEDDVHHDDWQMQNAKRRLLKTKYQTLYGKGGRKISIDSASDQQVNSAFRNAFSKRDLKMPHYLRTITKPWYETRIKNYESRVKSILPGTASLNELISAEYLAKTEGDHGKAEHLHDTIEKKLSSCSNEQLKELWKSYKPAGAILLDYSAFSSRI